MSTEDNLAEAAMATVAEKCCASCGVAEIDDVKLKPCPKCDRALYCSDECQQDHRERHDAECKKRAAELYDELLFKQPESSHLGDCPICFLPLPLGSSKGIIKSCCSQKVCIGCVYFNMSRESNEGLKKHRCPFCRRVVPKSNEEVEKLTMERAKLNDPTALHSLGFDCENRGDYERAFHYYSKAVALDDADSMLKLSFMYRDGRGVEEDKDKERILLEKAAIAGHPTARYNLGCFEGKNDRIDTAVKHFLIAAALGYEESLKALKMYYEVGYASKEDFAAALRAYQDSVDAMKSPQRQAAEVNYEYGDGYID